MYGRFLCGNCPGMVWFLKSSCLACQPYFNEKSTAGRERSKWWEGQSGKGSGGWMWLSQMCVGSSVLAVRHPCTVNTSVRKSTAPSWLRLPCRWSGSWGKISNWNIHSAKTKWPYIQGKVLTEIVNTHNLVLAGSLAGTQLVSKRDKAFIYGNKPPYLKYYNKQVSVFRETLPWLTHSLR